MADLNALIAQGAQFAAPADPFAQYGKMQQLQQGETTNQLNRMQMEEYRRKADVTNRLGALDPAAADYLAQIKRIDPKLGFDLEEQSIKSKNLSFTGTETQAKIEEIKRKLLDSSMRNMASNPSDENIIAHTQDYELNSLFANELPSIKATAQRLLGMTPDQRKAVLSGAGATAADLKPPAPTNIANLIRERNALPQGDPSRKLYDQQINDLGAANRNAQQRLDFDRSKFAWEKSNPGYELKEDANGGMVAINKRTLESVPVMVGGAAAPVAGAAAAVPAAAGGNRGSANVTDSAAPAAAGARTQLMGKGTALTESQSNAAMFGSAMAQAQQVLDKAQKEGTTTGAGTVNLAQGIVKYVPLGVGDKLVNDIYALAVNDPTKLFGPDVNQQKVGQAQLAFAIAYLRKTSGAAFGPSEVANTIMEYFPSVGEDQAVVKQKAESRKRAIAGMKMGAGREGAKFIEQYESPAAGKAGSSASDPLGLFPAKP
jgi:hypothetical protein